MVGHGGSSAGSYLADPTSPIPSHCASIVVTSTVRVNDSCVYMMEKTVLALKAVIMDMRKAHLGPPDVHMLEKIYMY